MGFDGKMGLSWVEARRLQVVRDAVAQTVSIARLTSHSRDRVGDELVRLGALQQLAAGQSDQIYFTWPAAFSGSVGNIDIIPLVQPESDPSAQR